MTAGTEKERMIFQKRYQAWEVVRNRLEEYIVPEVQASWIRWMAGERPAKRQRRKLKDRFDVEIRHPWFKGKAGRAWTIVKDFDNCDLAIQYERQYSEANPDTPVRMKVKRVPVEQ